MSELWMTTYMIPTVTRSIMNLFDLRLMIFQNFLAQGKGS